MTEHQILTCGVIAMLIYPSIAVYYSLYGWYYERKKRKEWENRNK